LKREKEGDEVRKKEGGRGKDRYLVGGQRTQRGEGDKGTGVREREIYISR
jgi:hypothetical protein